MTYPPPSVIFCICDVVMIKFEFLSVFTRHGVLSKHKTSHVTGVGDRCHIESWNVSSAMLNKHCMFFGYSNIQGVGVI